MYIVLSFRRYQFICPLIFFSNEFIEDWCVWFVLFYPTFSHLLLVIFIYFVATLLNPLVYYFFFFSLSLIYTTTITRPETHTPRIGHCCFENINWIIRLIYYLKFSFALITFIAIIHLSHHCLMHHLFIKHGIFFLFVLTSWLDSVQNFFLSFSLCNNIIIVIYL